MKSRAFSALAMIAVLLQGQPWQLALPGYRYEFPRDYFSHPDYQTEWWYYTGNLKSADGRRFGFELTFFRQAIDLPREGLTADHDPWRPDQIYLAHLALSDIDGGEFYHTERLNRAGPGLAGVSLDQHRCWNGNWQVRWVSVATAEQQLEAASNRLTLNLDLKPEKPLVINGQNGISQKGPESGEASHYISFTRLRAAGELQWKNTQFSVNGLAWMDHEFFTNQAHSAISGWDWFAIQLDNNEEVMLYRLKTKSGQENPYSSGTYVDTRGIAHLLDARQFVLTPGEVWQSADSGARYPIAWNITIPSLGLDLAERTALKNQELFTKGGILPAYWEGAVTYQGHLHGQPIRGVGYLEMTGYAGEPFARSY